jgi:hypothetical protein
MEIITAITNAFGNIATMLEGFVAWPIHGISSIIRSIFR